MEHENMEWNIGNEQSISNNRGTISLEDDEEMEHGIIPSDYNTSGDDWQLIHLNVVTTNCIFWNFICEKRNYNVDISPQVDKDK